MFDIVVLIVLVVVSFPFVVYFSVKFGTFAYLKAKQVYEETSKKGDR